MLARTCSAWAFASESLESEERNSLFLLLFSPQPSAGEWYVSHSLHRLSFCFFFRFFFHLLFLELFFSLSCDCLLGFESSSIVIHNCPDSFILKSIRIQNLCSSSNLRLLNPIHLRSRICPFLIESTFVDRMLTTMHQRSYASDEKLPVCVDCSKAQHPIIINVRWEV